MAGLSRPHFWWLLCGVYALWCTTTVTSNSRWCSRQCTCLNSYDTVDCTHKHITNVPELSNLTVNLYLDNNNITTLEVDAFRSLENLIVLNLEHNKIQSVSSDHFCGLKNLRILNLGSNKLKSFIISDNLTEECRLPALRQLILSDNSLGDLSPNLPFWAPNLETLNVSYNGLGSVLFNESFSTLQSLRVLDLRGNRIDQITKNDFSPLKAIPLNTLSLSECVLYSVEAEAFRGMTELVSLSLSRNLLSATVLEDIFNAIGNTSQLVQLDLREMVIPNVTASMFGVLKHLTTLDLFESSIKYIDPELFNYLPDLETLNVGRNELYNLTNVGALKKLRWFYADWNHLSSVDLTELDNLETIDLSGNKLESVPGYWLGEKVNLQLLNVSHNEITSVHPQSFSGLSLQVLDMSYNKIPELDGTGLSHLRKLYLAHNRLSSVTTRTYRNLDTTLEDIDLSYNNLTKLPHDNLKDFVALQELNLGQNNLRQALKAGDLRGYFQNMGHLQKLDIAGNAIMTIARHQLNYLHHLTTIDLSHNSIESLGDVALHEVTTLAKLDITGNLIQSVDVNVLRKMEYLEEIDLSSNPFNCTYCSMQAFLAWANRTVVMIINQSDHHKYQCYSPQTLRGLQLFDYRPVQDHECKIHKNIIETDLDWVMVGVGVVGVVVFLTLGGVLIFYTQICHKIKNLHYRWQIRYREVSGVEFMSEPRV